MAERMTRYQLAFAPFLNKYINDELSKHYGGRRVTGVLPGLQNQCGAWYVPGGFDSHMSPPKERKKNMGMNQTPVSERVHIGFFGKRNAGKSSVMNAVEFPAGLLQNRGKKRKRSSRRSFWQPGLWK